MHRALRRRETGGQPSPRAFQRAAAASPDLVARLELQRRLEGHAGCVNTLCFSDDGALLASGSDDRRVMLWDWNTGERSLSYNSGHHNNIFQARFVPHTNNKTVITCAADGQVRIGHLRGSGGGVQTALLATHGGRAHKLALDPTQPQCFYSSGEDGRVFHYDLRCPQARQSLLICTKASPRGGRERLELHSIHCNPLRPWQFAVGGSDIFVRVYDRRQALQPTAARQPSAAGLAAPVRRLAPGRLRSRATLLRRGHLACSVTSAVFSRGGQLLASYNDENIYLFASEGPMPLGQASRQAVAAAAEPALTSCRRRPGPASGQPQGAAAQQQQQQSQQQQQLLQATSSGGSLPRDRPGMRAGSGTVPPRRPSPASTPPPQQASRQLLESSSPAAWQPPAGAAEQPARMEPGSGGGSEMSVGGSSQAGSASEASSSQAGSSEAGSSEDGWGSGSDPEEAGILLAHQQLRRMLAGQPPEEEEAEEEGSDSEADAVGEAEADDEVLMTFTGHRNCRTVKGVSFLGEGEEYVMSGSDDGRIYVWTVADGVLRQWLPGDAHVVNCLEPHPALPLGFATSGIEDDIKLWAPTAPEPRPLPAAAARAAERNRLSQGPHRRPSASARRILQRLQQEGNGGDAVPGGCGVQ